MSGRNNNKFRSLLGIQLKHRINGLRVHKLLCSEEHFFQGHVIHIETDMARVRVDLWVEIRKREIRVKEKGRKKRKEKKKERKNIPKMVQHPQPLAPAPNAQTPPPSRLVEGE